MNEGFDAIIDVALEQLVADETKQLREQLDAANADRARLREALRNIMRVAYVGSAAASLARAALAKVTS